MTDAPVVKIRNAKTIFQASKIGALDQVEAFIERGADVNKPGRFDQTPLGVSCTKGHIEIARTLISAGANVNAGGSDGRDSGSLFGPSTGSGAGW